MPPLFSRPLATENPAPLAQITFTVLGKGSEEERDVRTLSVQPGSKTSIGRASHNSGKQLVARPDNAFFDCPVLSRDHAVLTYLTFPKAIMLTDTGSTHGTWVNGKKIDRHKAFELHSGDVVKFGDVVSRGQSTHDGVKVRFESTFHDQSTLGLPSNSFTAPLDSDVDDDASDSEIDAIVDQELESSRYSDKPATANSVDMDNHIAVSAAGPVSQGSSILNPVTIDDEPIPSSFLVRTQHNEGQIREVASSPVHPPLSGANLASKDANEGSYSPLKIKPFGSTWSDGGSDVNAIADDDGFNSPSSSLSDMGMSACDYYSDDNDEVSARSCSPKPITRPQNPQSSDRVTDARPAANETSTPRFNTFFNNGHGLSYMPGSVRYPDWQPPFIHKDFEYSAALGSLLPQAESGRFGSPVLPVVPSFTDPAFSPSPARPGGRQGTWGYAGESAHNYSHAYADAIPAPPMRDPKEVEILYETSDIIMAQGSHLPDSRCKEWRSLRDAAKSSAEPDQSCEAPAKTGLSIGDLMDGPAPNSKVTASRATKRKADEMLEETLELAILPTLAVGPATEPPMPELSHMKIVEHGELPSPSKRSKTQLAVTAAVGMVAGCVGTFGFLLSPLAERVIQG